MGICSVSRPAVFLDRDGVLVEEVYYPPTREWEAPLRPEDVRLIPEAADAARRLGNAGHALVLISNQAAFVKGKTTLRQLWLVHERFVALLADNEVRLDAIFYAYGHPEGVVPHFSGPSLDCKPAPYNVFIAAAQLDLDLSRSWLVGDRATDMHCAAAAGLQAIMVANPHHDAADAQPSIMVADLAAAADYVLGRAQTSLNPAAGIFVEHVHGVPSTT